MKYVIVLILISKSLSSFGQITFSEVLSMNEKTYKQIQANLLIDYIIIDDDVEYRYTPLIPCKPAEFGPDSCVWHCSMESYNHDNIVTKYPLNPVVFEKSSNKNYEIRQTSECTFAQNYNSSKKTAMTFIEVKEKKLSMSTNCKNELREISTILSIEIQFSDPYHWQEFKRSVANIATFQETIKYFEGDLVKSKYVIRKKLKNGYWEGTRIILYGEGPTYHAEIWFNILVD